MNKHKILVAVHFYGFSLFSHFFIIFAQSFHFLTRFWIFQYDWENSVSIIHLDIIKILPIIGLAVPFCYLVVKFLLEACQGMTLKPVWNLLCAVHISQLGKVTFVISVPLLSFWFRSKQLPTCSFCLVLNTFIKYYRRSQKDTNLVLDILWMAFWVPCVLLWIELEFYTQIGFLFNDDLVFHQLQGLHLFGNPTIVAQKLLQCLWCEPYIMQGFCLVVHWETKVPLTVL